MYFTEQPMSDYPEEEARKAGGISALMLSNKHFDAVDGSRLYNERIEEYLYAEEVGEEVPAEGWWEKVRKKIFK